MSPTIKRLVLATLTLPLIGLGTARVVAAEPPDRGGDRGPGAAVAAPPDRGDDVGPGPRGGRPRPGGPEGGPPPRGGGDEGPAGRPMRPDGASVGAPRGGPEAHYERLRAYIELVDRYVKLASDPTASGVAAVMTAMELHRQKGPEAAIAYFTKILPEVKNETVQRTIRLQLVDLYRQSNQPDKALEQALLLMTAAPAK